MQNQHTPEIFRYFTELSEHTSKVIFAYQVESNTFSFLNSAFEKIWSISVESAQSNPASLLETIHPEDKDFVINSYRQLINGTGKGDTEFRILVNGATRWLRLTDPVLIEESNTRHVLIGMVEDFTEVKEHYDNLEKFASKKNSILEILSHDLAGPLNNINGISSLLADEIRGYNNPDLEKMVGMITQTSARSIHMIREFVQQEFIESANSAFIKKRVNLVQKIQDSMEQYKNSEENLGKTFNFTAPDEEILVDVDDYKLVQAINNLISNSIKFTRDGGIISVSIEDRQEKVLISVADNGIGIPAKYHDTLFERFTNARRAGLKGEPSTGLGMSIIKTIVEWHGGKIWFESRENEGTTFYIEIPKE